MAQPLFIPSCIEFLSRLLFQIQGLCFLAIIFPICLFLRCVCVHCQQCNIHDHFVINTILLQNKCTDLMSLDDVCQYSGLHLKLFASPQVACMGLLLLLHDHCQEKHPCIPHLALQSLAGLVLLAWRTYAGITKVELMIN